jgi:RNA polymerase-binding transcription factor DksA
MIRVQSPEFLKEHIMPSLTASDIARFRARLRARDLELRRAIHGALVNNEDKTYAEVAGRVLDAAEQSVADLLSDARIIEMEKEVAEQADVAAALARIADGTYGVCIDCGDTIDPGRLDAWPTAKRCIRCQTHYESTHRGRGATPSL